MNYIIAKQPDGSYQTILLTPSGQGAKGHGPTKAHSVLNAVQNGGEKLAMSAPAKAKIVAALAQAAATPSIVDAIKNQAIESGKDLLKEGLKTAGLEAAKAAASIIPGGGMVIKALELASKYGPAKKLLSKLLPW